MNDKKANFYEQSSGSQNHSKILVALHHDPMRLPVPHVLV
jgi:hypothetical protein